MVAFSEQGKAGSFTALAALAFALAFGLLALAFITRPLAWRFMTFFIFNAWAPGFQMFKQMPQLLLAIVFILVAGFLQQQQQQHTNSKSNTNSWGCCSDSGLSMRVYWVMKRTHSDGVIMSFKPPPGSIPPNDAPSFFGHVVRLHETPHHNAGCEATVQKPGKIGRQIGRSWLFDRFLGGLTSTWHTSAGMMQKKYPLQRNSELWGYKGCNKNNPWARKLRNNVTLLWSIDLTSQALNTEHVRPGIFLFDKNNPGQNWLRCATPLMHFLMQLAWNILELCN